jgi:hypothetical protein
MSLASRCGARRRIPTLSAAQQASWSGCPSPAPPAPASSSWESWLPQACSAARRRTCRAPSQPALTHRKCTNTIALQALHCQVVFALSLWGCVVTLRCAGCDVQASSAAAPNFNMSDALWCARKGFDKSSVRDGSKKIVVITCDPCPCGLMTENDESRCHLGCCARTAQQFRANCNNIMQTQAPCPRYSGCQH